MADASGNNGNWIGTPYPIDDPYYLTRAGEFQNSYSAYGTFDQGGNVNEWTETLYQDGSVYRCTRGGNYGESRYVANAACRDDHAYATGEGGGLGFRLVNIPEPSSIVTLLCGLAGLVGMRRRRN